MILTATFSDPRVPYHISPKPAQVQGYLAVTVTSPWSVYEAGNTPHDPHRVCRTRIVRRRNLGWSCNFIVISYKVSWPQLGIVVRIGLRTSSKKLATSAAAKPLSFLRTSRFLSSRNSCNTKRSDVEPVSVFFNVTKLSGRVIDEFAVSSSGWSMEMLVITDVHTAGSGGKDQGQKCPYIQPRMPILHMRRFVQSSGKNPY